MSRKKQGGGRRRHALEHDEPFRSCIACRTSSARAEMLRFARAPDGSLGFDVRARLPGRGAWTCARAACVARAGDRGAFERAFEAPVLGAAGLPAVVAQTLAAEVGAGLGLLRRAGRLAAGRDDVSRALAESLVTALVLAHDLSERTRRDVEQRAGSLPIVTGPAQEDIGRAIGRKPTGVLGLLGGPRASLVLADLQRAASYASDVPPTASPPKPAAGAAPETPDDPAARGT